MTGYAFAMAPCFVCKRLITFNPVRVPSIVINGVREPVCQICIDLVNPIRRENGLPEIVPLPDAYDAVDEGDLQ